MQLGHTNLRPLAMLLMMMMMISEASTVIMFCFPLYIYFIIKHHDFGFSFFFILLVLDVIIMRFKTERTKYVSIVKNYSLSRRMVHCSRRSSASVSGSPYGTCVGQSGIGAGFAPNTRGALSVIIPSIVFSHQSPSVTMYDNAYQRARYHSSGLVTCHLSPRTSLFT
jgi:hypothetical protein